MRAKGAVAASTVLVLIGVTGYYLNRARLVAEIANAPNGTYGTFRTEFAVDENPVSEKGAWINGRDVGVDWANVQARNGRAFGTESGKVQYDDSTALIRGAWGADQMAQAKVYSIRQTSQAFEEVELRLRSRIAAHWATGYEINFRCLKTDKAYAEIVRWNGPLGSFTILQEVHGAQFGVVDGDIIAARIAGETITAYLNGKLILLAKDAVFSSGNPGIGFYLEGAGASNQDFGLTDLTASDMLDTRSRLDRGKPFFGLWPTPEVEQHLTVY